MEPQLTWYESRRPRLAKGRALWCAELHAPVRTSHAPRRTHFGRGAPARNHPAVNQADPSARLSALIHGARSVGHAVRRQRAAQPRGRSHRLSARETERDVVRQYVCDARHCACHVRMDFAQQLNLRRQRSSCRAASGARSSDVNAIAVLRVLTCSHLRARILRVAQVRVLIRNSASVECCVRGAKSRQGEAVASQLEQQ